MTFLEEIRSKALEIVALVDANSGPPPPPSGQITFPRNNHVFQRSALGPVNFTATKTGSGTFRLKNSAGTVIAESSGAFSDIPFGFWGTLELVDGATVLHSVKFGVGYHLIFFGQSNVSRNKEPGDFDIQATEEGAIIIGLPNSDGTDVVFHDTFHENLDYGMFAAETAKVLRARGPDPAGEAAPGHPGFQRNVPYCITICGQGSTTVQQFAAQPLLGRLVNTVLFCKPGLVDCTHGESNNETTGEQALADCYHTIINATLAVKPDLKWEMNLNDHPYSGQYWAIAKAQKLVVEQKAVSHPMTVVWGIDISRAGVPGFSLPQNLGRQDQEIHIVGARLQLMAALKAERFYGTRNYNV